MSCRRAWTVWTLNELGPQVGLRSVFLLTVEPNWPGLLRWQCSTGWQHFLERGPPAALFFFGIAQIPNNAKAKIGISEILGRSKTPGGANMVHGHIECPAFGDTPAGPLGVTVRQVGAVTGQSQMFVRPAGLGQLLDISRHMPNAPCVRRVELIDGNRHVSIDKLG